MQAKDFFSFSFKDIIPILGVVALVAITWYKVEANSDTDTKDHDAFRTQINNSQILAAVTTEKLDSLEKKVDETNKKIDALQQWLLEHYGGGGMIFKEGKSAK